MVRPLSSSGRSPFTRSGLFEAGGRGGAGGEGGGRGIFGSRISVLAYGLGLGCRF